jgi:hypothetical protein
MNYLAGSIGSCARQSRDRQRLLTQLPPPGGPGTTVSAVHKQSLVPGVAPRSDGRILLVGQPGGRHFVHEK